jgi:two-component system, OmpR family, sensor kinase
MAMSSPGGSGVWQRLRALPDRTPLSVKLIAAVLTLVLIALVLISTAGARVLESYLLGQADTSVQALIQKQSLPNQGQLGNPRPLPNEAVIWYPNGGQPQSVVVPVSTPDYYGMGSQFYGVVPQAEILAGPQIPGSPSSLPSTAASAITVPATSGGGRWRVVGVPATVTDPSNGTVTHGTEVLAIDVSSDYAVIGKLMEIDLIVGLIVILGLAMVGIAVVRASLRPLTDIERTAEAIAVGDLTRRVPDHDPRTEVGRLGQSLNTMLAQIEAAFDARAESEFAARQSEQRMRQFVADASHELRTPLTAIRGFAEYYRQRGGIAEIPGAAEPPTPTNGAGVAAAEAGAAAAETVAGAPGAPVPRHGSDYGPEGRSGPLTRSELDRIMQRVEQEASRMGVLVEDMLLLARLDQQRPLEQRTVDMLTLAADAVHDARLVAPDRSINLTVGAGAALLVIGDEVRLRQVIGNLMSNALNHTPEGTPIEVRVRLGSLDEWRTAAVGTHRAAVQGSRRGAAPDAGRAAVGVAGARRNAQPFPAVVFEIADQGPGLTPAQAEHVFERFYRVDQARTRHSGGAGLGLAIVAALVPAHGGTVWVESPPGGGAIFRIAIPLAPEARNSAADFDDSTDPGIPGVVDPYRPLGPAFTSEESPAARPDPPPLPKRHPGLSGHART